MMKMNRKQKRIMRLKELLGNCQEIEVLVGELLNNKTLLEIEKEISEKGVLGQIIVTAVALREGYKDYSKDLSLYLLAAWGRICPEIVARRVLSEIGAPITEKTIIEAVKWMNYLHFEAYAEKDTPYAIQNRKILSEWTGGTF
jgi:hypothetical protein